MIWDILEKKLADAGIASEAAGNYYFNEMPGDVKVGVMLRSPLSGIKFDPHLPGYYTPVLQVIVRHVDPVEGEKMAYDVVNALRIVGTETYPATEARGSVHLKAFFPRELPIRYPRQEGGTIEWSINFRTAFSVQGGFTPGAI